jgi:hypothetical protein
MASVDRNGTQLVIGLDNDETNNLVGSLGAVAGPGGAAVITAFWAKVGITALLGAAGPWVAAAIAAHVTWEVLVIRASNKGQGVFLYVPGPVWMSGGLGIVIPHTRTVVTGFDAHKDDGTMTSAMADEITWHIDRGAGKAEDCKFVLVNNCDWAKRFQLHIGADEYEVKAEGHSTAENSTWAKDLPETHIVFEKPQFLGQWGGVGLDISDFGGLNGQDVTSFRWVKD